MSEPALDPTSISPPPAAPDNVLCALCGSEIGGTPRFVNQQPACAACVEKVKAELAAERPTATAYLPAVLGGALGAIVAAAVWAGIGVATELEVGYVAVLVGFLSGFGVKIGARGKRGAGLQLLAAALAVVGLVLAKAFMLGWFAMKGAHEAGVELGVFDPRLISAIVEFLPQTFSPFDILWIVLAIGAAYRIPAASKVQVHGD